jgi:hypothetical protein
LFASEKRRIFNHRGGGGTRREELEEDGNWESFTFFLSPFFDFVVKNSSFIRVVREVRG